MNIRSNTKKISWFILGVFIIMVVGIYIVYSIYNNDEYLQKKYLEDWIHNSKIITNQNGTLDQNFFGTWKKNLSNITATFASNGTVLHSDCDCHEYWEILNNTLITYLPLDPDGMRKIVYTEDNYQFSTNNSTLTLISISSGTVQVYTKIFTIAT